MNEIGHFSLCFAWLFSLYAAVFGIVAGYKKNSKIFLSTVNASQLVFAFNLLAIGSLAYGFLTDDYTNQYVWQYSNRDMESIYKVSAIWGGMDGSMMLWSFILSISICILARQSLKIGGNIMPWVLSVANSSSVFFLTVVLYFTNPFRFLHSDYIPPDGNGLNPLLQNPYMAVHPPMLYMGFTTLAIPYAFCMGALLSGNLNNEWLKLTRRWILIAWAFLTAGIVMGGHWAYLELGWGGFWAWDPVENASFLPWLTATAFLHSVMVQERKNMLKFWNVWLIVATYSLTVFGTFLTRSGVVQSVHAFASTDIGWIFLTYLGALVGLALVLTIYRREDLKSERKIESVFSREAAFLVNNLIFLSICFAILWGVLFPVFSEAITGSKQAIGIPFYNAINVPLFLLLIFMMGVGPLIAWKKASFKSIMRTFSAPFILAIIFAAVLMYAGVEGFYPVLSYALCFFVLMTVLAEYSRALRVQRASAENAAGLVGTSARLLKRHSNRYVGYLVHIGVLIMTVSITAAMASKTEKEFSLSPNEVFNVGRYSLKLNTVQPKETENYNAVFADVTVHTTKDDQFYADLKPEMRAYTRNNEQTTEVALKMGLREDLYLVLAGINDDGSRASFKVFINPLQIWLWIGTMVVVFSTVFLIIPKARNI
jgi:cytochrome c-type biogenesis protein CcmF